MKTKILAAILLLPAIAFADPASDNGLDGAIAREHESSNRVFYYAHKATIAERDLATSTLRRQVARSAWDDAIRADHPSAAGAWAVRYHEAKREQADARERVALFSKERDEARANFRVAAQDVRELTRVARAERAPTRIARR
jgi:hypothetical protein